MPVLTTGSKNVAVAGTRERLVAVASNVAVKAVTIVAKAANAGKIYVGNAGVSSANTPPLEAGDAVRLAADEPFNLSDIYVDVSVGGEGVDYVALE